jgi:hypothetical protein
MAVQRRDRPRGRKRTMYRRRSHRKRRMISSRSVTLIRPIFRFSVGRDAYVLRVVGDWVGPVLQIARSNEQAGLPGRTMPK